MHKGSQKESIEKEVWEFLDRHLQSVFTKDIATYKATTGADLSLYEWWITPHRQDGLDFHFFMIENSWAGTEGAFRYDLFEPRCQLYGETTGSLTAVVTYTFMLSTAQDGKINHHTHNESRVLIKGEDGWKVVHVHKSPAGQAHTQ